MKAIIRILILMLLAASNTFAEHIYIAQAAAGLNNGTSAANAHAYTFFNSPGNWDSLVNTTNDKIGPGDTVHITGTLEFTGATTSSLNTLTFQGAGTVAAPITLKFDVGSKIRHPHGFPTGVVNGVLQNVVIEGQNSNPMFGGAFTGIDVEIWNNGTTRGNQVDGCRTMQFANSTNTNVTIKNLYLYGAYVRTENSTTDAHESGNSLSIVGQHNIVVDNCRFDHAEGGVGVTATANPSTGFRITNCYIYATSTAIKIGASSGCRNDGVAILHNRLDGFSFWAGLANPNQHHCDGIQTILPADGFVSNITAAYNHIGPNLGLYGSFNAHIYFQFNVNGSFIYNNLLTAQSTPTNPLENNARPGTANGFITEISSTNNYFSSPSGIRSIIANNTIIGAGSGQGISATFADITGNIIVNTGTMIDINGQQQPNALHGQFVNSTKNIFFHPSGQYEFGAGGFIFGSLSSWQTHPTALSINGGVGWDLNSIVSNTGANFDTGAILTGSSAIGFATTQTLFSDDLVSAVRTVPWDAGAREFVTGGPVPPTVSSSSINAAGTQFAMVMSEAVVFGSGGNGGITLASLNGTVTLGTPSIAGTTITWPITNRLIGQSEALTRTYVQPINGIEAQDDGQDLGAFSSVPITNNSTVAQVNIPTFSPAPGSYSTAQNVTMTSSTPGATIRYTTNGVTPTSTTGTVYTGPVTTGISTTYTARAFLSGMVDSNVATGAYQIGDFILGSAWTNINVAPQAGTFTWSFRATPSVAPTDAPVALADHPAGAFTDLAVVPRFNPSGVIDARNGGVYSAVSVFPYSANQAYDFVVTVNVPAHTYSMTVVQAAGGPSTTIATNYAFRNEQSTVTDLDVFAGIATPGTVAVSNMIFSTGSFSKTGASTNSAGSAVTLTFNSQPAFGTGGNGGFTIAASGGAVTASNPTVGTNSITWNTLSRQIALGEALTCAYVQPGNGIEASSGGTDLPSFTAQTVINNSSVDLVAPTPNPMTFSAPPSAPSSFSTTMTANLATDANSPPVEYYFDETSGNPGGTDSGWQASRTYTNNNLSAGIQYTYRVLARDSALNQTTPSASSNVTTPIIAGGRVITPSKTTGAGFFNP